MKYSPLSSRRGFSILMALGTIAVLLVLVSSLALMYLRESRLSRYLYDDLLASTSADGMFEYAMLKVRNHRDGFQDAVSSGQLDGTLLMPSLDRSKNLEARYGIIASSTGHTFTLSGGEHLIVPLFVSSEELLASSTTSKKPWYNTGVTNAANLNISGLGNNSWTIIATEMVDGKQPKSVSLAGEGDISGTKTGNMRIRASQCYSHTDGSSMDCSAVNTDAGDEEIVYFYDKSLSIDEFLKTYTDPYFIMYNAGAPGTAMPVTFSSSTAFTLPLLQVTAESKKGNSSQIYQFTEDKAKYYDVLKYGIYNQEGP